MLDQSFSAENFRKILDIENRKGIYLEGEFLPDVDRLNNDLKDVNKALRFLKRRGLSKEAFVEKKSELTQKKEELKEKKHSKLIGHLHRVSDKVTSPPFKLSLERDDDILDKAVYKTARSLETILTLKQLQYNFRKLYKVKQSNRYHIVSQLKCVLNDGFPKIIVKTDISSFYESIPQDKLMEKINNENLLTYLSRRFIQQILTEYKVLSGEDSGIPRGIGISPYLSELYMRDVDSKIRKLPKCFIMLDMLMT